MFLAGKNLGFGQTGSPVRLHGTALLVRASNHRVDRPYVPGLIPLLPVVGKPPRPGLDNLARAGQGAFTRGTGHCKHTARVNTPAASPSLTLPSPVPVQRY